MDRAQEPSSAQKRSPVCSRAGTLCACVVIAGALLGDTLFFDTSHGVELDPNDAAVPVQVAPVVVTNFPLYLDGLGTVETSGNGWDDSPVGPYRGSIGCSGTRARHKGH